MTLNSRSQWRGGGGWGGWGGGGEGGGGEVKTRQGTGYIRMKNIFHSYMYTKYKLKEQYNLLVNS